MTNPKVFGFYFAVITFYPGCLAAVRCLFFDLCTIVNTVCIIRSVWRHGVLVLDDESVNRGTADSGVGRGWGARGGPQSSRATCPAFGPFSLLPSGGHVGT